MSAPIEPQVPVPSAELEGIGIRVGGPLVAWFAYAELAEDWARENFFGQWLAHACSMPNRPPISPAELEVVCRESSELAGVGIWVEGELLAWFADAEMAKEWADELFEQWVVHPCSIPNRPPFTPEQLETSRREAEELLKLFAPGRLLGD